MTMISIARRAVVLLAIWLAQSPAAHAQDIEPRAYSNAPVGVNFVIVGGVLTQGDLAFDTSVPIRNAELESARAVFAYARTLDLWGKSGKFDVIMQYASLEGAAEYQGQSVQREITGFGQPAFRLSVNLAGAPAMGLADFSHWKQDAIVGASLQVSPPVGQYDPDRLLNISPNRWSVKPEVGVSKAVGPWILELQAAALLFGDNDEFFGGTTRSQDPIYSLQTHVIRSFPGGRWLSVDLTWFTGGQSSIDGVRSDDLQRNWRAGATFAVPVDRLNSLKFSASSGVSARTGNNYDAIGVAWQHRWGGGL